MSAVDKNGKQVSSLGSSLLVPLLSGGMAGTAVDVALFPIDTIKTRLQAEQGFLKAGGFKGIYNGLSAAAAGSAPGGALFFMSYEFFKSRGETIIGSNSSYAPVVHMFSAAMGEVVSCLIRVPTENVKQKMQTGQFNTFKDTVVNISQSQGLRGFYTGYITTACREIPFSFIQFPMYEAFKSSWSDWQGGDPLTPIQSACCGSIAGGIAGGLTTPLDVVKTRLMTSKTLSTNGMIETMVKIYNEEGAAKLFSGVTPRVTFICLGGFVFFGAYETGKKMMSQIFD